MKAVKNLIKRKKAAGEQSPVTQTGSPTSPKKPALKTHHTNPNTGTPLVEAESSQLDVEDLQSDVGNTKNFPSASSAAVDGHSMSSKGIDKQAGTSQTSDERPRRLDLPGQDAKTRYKGVSQSFKGLSATEQFDVSEDAADLNQLNILTDAYESIPLLEQTKLPRGGISMETQAVGRVQFGIPPETIKDSMSLGVPVPQVYIVPAERFCREMGPALGVNLAEFEFPAYFNFFVYKKRCTLVVDSQEAQDNIVCVFSETLLGPAQFRGEGQIPFEEEDFAPDFPRDAIPNLQRELEHFRIMPDGSELSCGMLLDFCQFKQPRDGYCHEDLGAPPGGSDDNAVDAGGNEANSVAGEGTRGKNSSSDRKARWVGDVATVWPTTATEEQKQNRSIPRVEIFKMPSGTEYIVHDIDSNNNIIGKARFSGHVKVSETMSVEGFGGRSIMDDSKGTDSTLVASEQASKDDDSYTSAEIKGSPLLPQPPPTFSPPSFGVTVLGNSHGFDKSGSTSGYVLWINGRGVMIDPPPYSSATLEREGIRPRMIVGIILTHCHADHDAGAFQKVLTGSPVVVITTPTIYKSFIRKYAALASLSPALLRHSHRHKAAIIGEPLRFQGATFHFTYSLHTIPCVGFRVDWRGRSMVFTGDHMNKPVELDRLQKEGVLSMARANDLRNLPLQETDLLLHEAGAPPIHTPLEVLMKLPPRVKKRLYIVHTSQIPEEFNELRVAPTGTAGTLRLDQLQKGGQGHGVATSTWMERNTRKQRSSQDAHSISLDDDEVLPSPWSSASNNEYESISMESLPDDQIATGASTSFSGVQPSSSAKKALSSRNSLVGIGGTAVPLVSLRPASSTDAWFILNLLSAVPFMSSLSYASTMEVLETARVDAYCKNDVIVPASNRGNLLCVVWEGTCVERNRSEARIRQAEKNLSTIDEQGSKEQGAVWHAGDWTAPIALQPEKRLSGDSENSTTHDLVAMSVEGVKVIKVEFSSLHRILKSGSDLYRKYLYLRSLQKRRLNMEEAASHGSKKSTATQKLLTEALRKLNVLELLDQNSAFRKLSAVQKRHLECLAEGPVVFGAGEKLWQSGAPVDRAFLIVAGTVSFVPRRRNAGSATVSSAKCAASINAKKSNFGDPGEDASDLGEEMKHDVDQAIEEMGESVKHPSSDEVNAENRIQLENLFSRARDGLASSTTEANDFAKLSRNLQSRAEALSSGQASDVSVESCTSDDSDYVGEGDSKERKTPVVRRRSSRARFANKVLGRLYSRRAFTGGLVFSRGHFLGDVSKMVAGMFSSNVDADLSSALPSHGFGDDKSGPVDTLTENLADMMTHEQEDESHITHTSTLMAGKDGCVVLVFQKSLLRPFLDEYPGLLLSLLGTQVVV